MVTPTQFSEAITALGNSDRERAKVLGVSRKTLIDYRLGRLPRTLITLLTRPEILRALAADAEAAQTPEPADIAA